MHRLVFIDFLETKESLIRRRDFHSRNRIWRQSSPIRLDDLEIMTEPSTVEAVMTLMNPSVALLKDCVKTFVEGSIITSVTTWTESWDERQSPRQYQPSSSCTLHAFFPLLPLESWMTTTPREALETSGKPSLGRRLEVSPLDSLEDSLLLSSWQRLPCVSMPKLSTTSVKTFNSTFTPCMPALVSGTPSSSSSTQPLMSVDSWSGVQGVQRKSLPSSSVLPLLSMHFVMFLRVSHLRILP